MHNFIIVPERPACYPNWQKQEGYSKQVEHNGQWYRLEKHYKKFSCGQLILRRIGAILVTVFSVGLALCSKKTRNLFTQKRKVVQFGIPWEKPPELQKSSQISKLPLEAIPTAHSVMFHEKDVTPFIHDIEQIKEKVLETTAPMNLEEELTRNLFIKIFNYGVRVAIKLEDKRLIVDGLCDLFRSYLNRGGEKKCLSFYLTHLTYNLFSLYNYYQWHDENNKSIFNCTTWTNCPVNNMKAPFYVCKNYNNLPQVLKPLLELLIFNGAELSNDSWRLAEDKIDDAAIKRGVMDKNLNRLTSPFKVFQDIKAHHLTRLELTKRLIAEITAEQQLREKVVKEQAASSPSSLFNTLPKEVIDIILNFSY